MKRVENSSDAEFISSLKKAKEDHANLHCPHPPPLADTGALLVRELENLLKDNITTGKVPFAAKSGKFIVPVATTGITWWSGDIRAWALSTIADKKFPVDTYGERYNAQLNGCMEQIEETWFAAHPDVPMHIDADACEPDSGTMCIVFDIDKVFNEEK